MQQQQQTAVVIPQDTLDAQRMNRAHREIVEMQTSAKDKAAGLGDRLIAKKAELKHGEFIPWIKANCDFSHKRAKEYMQVARAKSTHGCHFDACTSIREVLALGKSASRGTSPAKVEPTDEDLKTMGRLKTLAERGATEGERASAQSKLDAYSSAFGDDQEEVKKKAAEAAEREREEVPDSTQIQMIKTAMMRAGPEFLADWLLKAMIKDHDLFKSVMERLYK